MKRHAIPRVATPLFTALGALALVVGLSGVAAAGVSHEGTWPGSDKHVTLDAPHVTRSEAVTQLAKAAGWSVVLRMDDDAKAGKPFDVHVTDQPADKVLDVVLGDGDWVAKRDGSLITISAAPPGAASTLPSVPVVPQVAAVPTVPAVPAVPTTPPAVPPMATVRGEDRVIHGGSLVVGADEIVHDVTILGGSLELLGTATGNVTVLGGSAHIKKGSHVIGSATAVGGSIDIDDGAQVDGDVGVVGGSLDRHKGSKIGGAIRRTDDESIGTHVDTSPLRPKSLLRSVSDAVTRAAMLFIFGAVLFALAGGRMNQMRVEAASRPMRSFAVGVVGGLVALLTIAIIGITVVGLPVAIVLTLGAVFGTYAGVCAVLATVGKALVGHKTDNPHAHLLVGCALFLVSGAIPFVSGLVTFFVVVTSIGVVIATRGGGLFATKRPFGAGPYRTEATV
jgi:hypothetical protein